MTEFSLSFERQVDATPAQLFAGWTQADLLTQWFTPAPWQTVDAVVDLRVGGEFTTEMRGPNGEQVRGTGCYLVIEPDRKLIWTNALLPNFQPQGVVDGGFLFTAQIDFEPSGQGTLYRATVTHQNAEDRDLHASIGFEAGWNAALDQLVALING